MTDLSERHRTHVAWRGALIAALLSAVGWPLDALIARQLPGAQLFPAVAASLSSALLLLALVWRRTRISARQASLAFLLNTGIVATGLWISNAQFAVHAPHWAPFQANKLGVLTVALLAPELWVGLLSIAIYGVTAVAQWSLLDAQMRSRADAGEPWAMLAYALFSVILLVQTVRRFRIERDLVRAQRDAAALEQLARTFLAIRDFANTPLQTIVSVTDLIARRSPALVDHLAPVQRALDRLRELNEILSRLESRVRWKPGDESLDPKLALERAAKLEV